MNDKQMLEFAAWAMGIKLEYRRGSDAYYYDDPEEGRDEWLPLANTRQAFSMQTKLFMLVNVMTDRVVVDTLKKIDASEEFYGFDGITAEMAACRAITRAAAEIGWASL